MQYDDDPEISGYGYGAQIDEVGADDDGLDDILGAMDEDDEYGVGDEYALGDDYALGDEQELGARRRRRRPSRSRSRPSRSRSAYAARPTTRPTRGVFRPVQPKRLSDLPLPINPEVVPAGGDRLFALQPQLPFKPYRLSIPSVISGGLFIEDVKVGNASQFVAAGAIPVECFDTDATNVSLKGDTAVPGVDIIITVSNPTGEDKFFTGMIVGDVAHA